jgi:DNA-binding transcriptional LysR family regulator
LTVSYDYYKVFYRVVECGNMTLAAKKLYLAQSTVSRTIQQLENKLGCMLLVRSTRGVKLTEEGQILYRHLKAAFEHIEIAEERLTNIRRLNEGVLRIGASELTLDFYLLPYLERFKREHPNICIRLSYSNPELAINELDSGLLDMAVLASPLVENEAIRVFPIKSINYTLFAGPRFNDLKSRKVNLRDLKDYPFICMEKGMSVRIYADRLAESEGFALQPECEVGSMPLLISMVQINLGLSFAPALHIQKALEDNTVFEIKLQQDLPHENICLLTSRDAPKNNISNEFIKILFNKSSIL